MCVDNFGATGLEGVVAVVVAVAADAVAEVSVGAEVVTIEEVPSVVQAEDAVAAAAAAAAVVFDANKPPPAFLVDNKSSPALL
jgi:hypothetical protein